MSINWGRHGIRVICEDALQRSRENGGLGSVGGGQMRNASFNSQCMCKIELMRLFQSILNAWCEKLRRIKNNSSFFFFFRKIGESNLGGQH